MITNTASPLSEYNSLIHRICFVLTWELTGEDRWFLGWTFSSLRPGFCWMWEPGRWAAGGALQRLQPGHNQGGAAPGDGGCWGQAELHPRLTGDQWSAAQPGRSGAVAGPGFWAGLRSPPDEPHQGLNGIEIDSRFLISSGMQNMWTLWSLSLT